MRARKFYKNSVERKVRAFLQFVKDVNSDEVYRFSGYTLSFLKGRDSGLWCLVGGYDEGMECEAPLFDDIPTLNPNLNSAKIQRDVDDFKKGITCGNGRRMVFIASRAYFLLRITHLENLDHLIVDTMCNYWDIPRKFINMCSKVYESNDKQEESMLEADNVHLSIGDKMRESLRKIDEEFNKFFEFPTDDHRTVTSTSCKLFAEYCVDKMTKQYEAELEDKNKLIKDLSEVDRDRRPF